MSFSIMTSGRTAEARVVDGNLPVARRVRFVVDFTAMADLQDENYDMVVFDSADYSIIIDAVAP